MNWKLIFGLAGFGVLMGILSLFGYTQGIEWLLWLVIAIICSVVIAKTVSGKFFLTGLLVGILDGVFNSIVQSVFFDAYLSHNPRAAEGFGPIPGGLDPRFFILIAGPFIGLLYGLVLGLFAWLAGKLFRKPADRSATQ
ncbi:MAG TPA: hypothetical protein VI546_05440 [candidate division Zixibacteria bacterium]|nr:hypothetical protein [candidate division Zixibacteria bacterium]